VATEARASDLFTEYDGHVPEAGPDLDPFAPDARPLSASRLERLGTCPLDFFFQDVLGVAPPEEHGTEPGVWLDALERGSLLHEVFHDFMERVSGEGRLPDLERDGALIAEILHERVAARREELPPPSEEVLAGELDAMERIVHIFLAGQDELLAGRTPAHFEVAIGMPPVGRGTALDSREEVEIRLPGGRSIRARGQVDRIDVGRRGGRERLALWDYKTGSSWGYDLADPHRGGRRVQNTLYTEMIRARLEALGSDARIESFGYFFPSLKAYGERIAWPAERLAEGPAMLDRLCRLLATGCFPETDAPGDLRFSDYGEVRDDLEASCRRILEKAANPANEVLRPFVELRGLAVEDDDA
jgi:ATP-dependent helicase/nuclease subunit B